MRADPTASVAPGRTGSFQRLQAPQGVIASALSGAFGTVNANLLANLRAAWDAMNNGWNQWVLNYSQATQLNLLKNIGFESPSWADLSYLLIGIVVSVSLLGAGWTLWERSRLDPWLRLLALAQKRLTQAGVQLAPNSPPRRIAEQMCKQLDEPETKQQRERGQTATPMTQPMRDWLLRLEALRYARPTSNSQAGLMALQRELKQMDWPK